MKTAISLPDDIYERATRQARAMGISRSEFFADAARRYLAEIETATLTARIDAALLAADAAGTSEHDSQDVALLTRRALAGDDW